MQGYDSFLDRELEKHMLATENYNEDEVSDLVDELIDSGKVAVCDDIITMKDVDERVVESDEFLLNYFTLDIEEKQNEKLELVANARILQANILVLESLR